LRRGSADNYLPQPAAAREHDYFQAAPFLTLKSFLFMANLNEEELRAGPHFTALRQLAPARPAPVVPILSDLEVELLDFPP
jgi:ribosome-binding ATPase YchF (GTP1/OBG family)